MTKTKILRAILTLLQVVFASLLIWIFWELTFALLNWNISVAPIAR